MLTHARYVFLGAPVCTPTTNHHHRYRRRDSDHAIRAGRQSYLVTSQTFRDCLGARATSLRRRFYREKIQLEIPNNDFILEIYAASERAGSDSDRNAEEGLKRAFCLSHSFF